MIEFRTGDIFDSYAEALVCPVNCEGVMGKGLAKEFKRIFPENYSMYRNYCLDKRLNPGHIFVTDRGKDRVPRFILNFPTKDRWRNKSNLVDIQHGLNALQSHIIGRMIKSVAVPTLGCGLGGLNWIDVKPLIQKMSDQMDGRNEVAMTPDHRNECRIIVYEPKGG